MSGDYRGRAELDADALRDPISKMQVWLLRERILDAEGINALERRADMEVQAASDRAVQAAFPGSIRSSSTSTLKT